MIPGCTRNWRRTSKITAPAARETALIARPLNMNTTDAPISNPTRFFGFAASNTPAYSSAVVPAPLAAFVTASRNEPNSAVAANTAVAIAIPLVIAFVVLPTASRLVKTLAPSPCTSPDISAIP